MLVNGYSGFGVYVNRLSTTSHIPLSPLSIIVNVNVSVVSASDVKLLRSKGTEIVSSSVCKSISTVIGTSFIGSTVIVSVAIFDKGLKRLPSFAWKEQVSTPELSLVNG